MKQSWKIYPKIYIQYNRLFGGLLWIFLEDRGVNVGRYTVRTLGLDGIAE